MNKMPMETFTPGHRPAVARDAPGAAHAGQSTGPLHARLAAAMSVARYHGVDLDLRGVRLDAGRLRALSARAGGLVPAVRAVGALRPPELPSDDEDRQPRRRSCCCSRTAAPPWWSAAIASTACCWCAIPHALPARRRCRWRNSASSRFGTARRCWCAPRATSSEDEKPFDLGHAHPPRLGREIDPARRRDRLDHHHHSQRAARADDHDHAEYRGDVSQHEHAHADRRRSC